MKNNIKLITLLAITPIVLKAEQNEREAPEIYDASRKLEIAQKQLKTAKTNAQKQIDDAQKQLETAKTNADNAQKKWSNIQQKYPNWQELLDEITIQYKKEFEARKQAAERALK